MASTQQDIKLIKDDIQQIKDVISEQAQTVAEEASEGASILNIDDIRAKAREVGEKAKAVMSDGGEKARAMKVSTSKFVRKHPVATTLGAATVASLTTYLLTRRK